LVGAYHVAAEAHPLQYFKDMLADHQKAMQEDQELREQREAAKAAKASKKKRKSEAADEDVDMEDADAEEAENKKSSKKRKKEVESEGDEEKVGLIFRHGGNLLMTIVPQPAKTPKTAQKLKLTTPKAPGTTEKKETAKATKPKSEKKKSAKAATSDEEMAEEEVKEPAKPVDPVQERKDREKEGEIAQSVRMGYRLNILQCCSSATSYKRASSPVTKRLKKAKWRPCPTT
jgi:hypothetical protein